MIQWMGGAVESVHAFAATLSRRVEAEDSIVVNLKYRSGALGSINVTNLAYPKNFEGSLVILGERGTVKVGGVALNKIEHWQFADSHPMDNEVEQVNTNPPSVYGFGHLPYYRHVADVLDGAAEPLLTGREGRKSVEIIEAAYESSRTGSVVSITGTRKTINHRKRPLDHQCGGRFSLTERISSNKNYSKVKIQEERPCKRSSPSWARARSSSRKPSSAPKSAGVTRGATSSSTPDSTTTPTCPTSSSKNWI